MKRLHVHVAVENLDQSIRFYSVLFAQEPTVAKVDYAKWMLDDPRLNFAISTRGAAIGVDHLGIQVEDADELAEVYDRLKHAGGATLEEGETTCCYAKSEKTWIVDPSGISWETFLTSGESAVFGENRKELVSESACCAPSVSAPMAHPAVAAGAAPAESSSCCGQVPS